MQFLVIHLFLSCTSNLLVRLKHFPQIVLNCVRLRFSFKMRLYGRSFVLFKQRENFLLWREMLFQELGYTF